MYFTIVSIILTGLLFLVLCAATIAAFVAPVVYAVSTFDTGYQWEFSKWWYKALGAILAGWLIAGPLLISMLPHMINLMEAGGWELTPSY